MMIVIWASRILIGCLLICFYQQFFPLFSLISVWETWSVYVMRMTPIFCILSQFSHFSLILNQTMPRLIMILTHWFGRNCLKARPWHRFLVIFLNISYLDLYFRVYCFKPFLAFFWHTLFEFWRHLKHPINLVLFEFAFIILPAFRGRHPIVHLQRLGSPTCSTGSWGYLLLISRSTFS